MQVNPYTMRTLWPVSGMLSVSMLTICRRLKQRASEITLYQCMTLHLHIFSCDRVYQGCAASCSRCASLVFATFFTQGTSPSPLPPCPPPVYPASTSLEHWFLLSNFRTLIRCFSSLPTPSIPVLQWLFWGMQGIPHDTDKIFQKLIISVTATAGGGLVSTRVVRVGIIFHD